MYYMIKGLSSFLVAASMIAGTGLAVLIVEKLGRKVLLVTSDALMCVSIFGLAVFFFVKENSGPVAGAVAAEDGGNSTANNTTLEKAVYFSVDFVEKLAWLPLLSLVCYIVTFSIGKVNISLEVGKSINLSPPLSLSLSSQG